MDMFTTVVENASRVTTKDVPSAGQATTSPAEGEKNTKDADTNLKDELVDLLGNNVVTQYYTKKEMCFFKFKSEEQMNSVLDQSPWLVNGKPMIVQKWDRETIIIKEAPCKITIWIWLYNVPLEAWSNKEISTISSTLGMPIKMDHMTAEMCKQGSGRLRYARVLVEIAARKAYIDKVEIDYVDNKMYVKKMKWVKVEYSWKPERCNHCWVFGHNFNNCKARPRTIAEVEKGINKQDKGEYNTEGFVEVRNMKNKVGNFGNYNNGYQGNKMPARRDQNQCREGLEISKKNAKELKRGANKYVVNEENGSNVEVEFTDKRKDRMGNGDSEEDDVYVNQNGSVQGITTMREMCFFKFKSEEQMNSVLDQSPWLVNGKPMIVQKWDRETIIIKEAPCKITIWIWLYNVPLEAWSNKEISTISSTLGMPIKMDHMTAEMCKQGSGRLRYARVLVEIAARKAYIDKVEIDYVDNKMYVKKMKWVKVEYSWKPERCNHCWVFGHNFNNCKARPRTIAEVEKGINKQDKGEYNTEGFVEVRNMKNKVGNFGNYNNGYQGNKMPARRDQNQCREGLEISKKNAKELKRGANKYVVNEENGSNVEVEFTDKRKDRMGNGDSEEDDVYVNQNGSVQGITTMSKAHGIFLPFIVSDHCPAVLVVRDGMPRKKKSFRGCQMFKVVKQIKNFKKASNDLNYWKNRNLFNNVVVLKQQLKEDQSNLEVDPFNLNKRMEVVEIINKYIEAIEDELKLLHKTTKIKWLRERDNNYAFFYSILKSRKHRNRVETICEEDGDIVIKKLSEEDTANMITEAWSIIGSDTCLAIKEILNNGKMLGELNATVIALVPKIDTPDKDKILITQEFLKGYNRKQGAKRCAMKIDFQKAYDTDSAKGKARVAWNLMCRPKDQGGLAIKPLKRWNECWPLRDFILDSVIFEARFKGNETLNDGIINGNWDWPVEWGDLYPVLSQINIPYLINEEGIVLLLNVDNEVEYSTKFQDFQGKRFSPLPEALEDRKHMVVDYIAPLVNEQQLEQAAKDLPGNGSTIITLPVIHDSNGHIS
nr:hypothetical protein [Tanacetum cinerariifolium]